MVKTKGLCSHPVFAFFEEIASIPHGSGNVEQISNYLAGFAAERNLEYKQDACRNVVIIKEAAPGYEKAEPVILQGHMDMVAVKVPGLEKDLEREGLSLVVQGDDLFAEGTSLGGDDGIALAYALAILDAKDLPHPRLEVVFTVDEETGMEGAQRIDLSMLKGRRMLNIDSEEEGIFLAGCAGGARVDWKLSVTRILQQGRTCRIRVKGLAGGHSGVEIHQERGNANRLLGQVLYGIWQKTSFHILDLSGGLADNAIPREAEVVILCREDRTEAVMECCRHLEQEIREEMRSRDPGFVLECEAGELQEAYCLTPEDSRKGIGLLFGAYDGVQNWSRELEGLVETSLNLGILKTEEGCMGFQFSVRSSLESAKKTLIARLENMAWMCGAECTVRGEYPGWTYSRESPFRDYAVSVYEDLYGVQPQIQAIHAGLECGILQSKLEGLECISLGPDIRDIHTTEERMSISSALRVWDYLLELLKCVPKE